MPSYWWRPSPWHPHRRVQSAAGSAQSPKTRCRDPTGPVEPCTHSCVPRCKMIRLLNDNIIMIICYYRMIKDIVSVHVLRVRRIVCICGHTCVVGVWACVYMMKETHPLPCASGTQVTTRAFGAAVTWVPRGQYARMRVCGSVWEYKYIYVCVYYWGNTSPTLRQWHSRIPHVHLAVAAATRAPRDQYALIPFLSRAQDSSRDGPRRRPAHLEKKKINKSKHVSDKADNKTQLIGVQAFPPFVSLSCKSTCPPKPPLSGGLLADKDKAKSRQS